MLLPVSEPSACLTTPLPTSLPLGPTWYGAGPLAVASPQLPAGLVVQVVPYELCGAYGSRQVGGGRAALHGKQPLGGLRGGSGYL